MTKASDRVGTVLARIFANVPNRRKPQAVAVFLMMLAGAVAELLTLGAVLPFLALVADPQAGARYPRLAHAFAGLGLGEGVDMIAGLAILFCIIAVLAAVVRLLLAWASQKYIFRLGFDLGVALYERMLSQPYQFHVRNDGAQILSAINKIQQLLNQALMPLLQGLTSLIIAVFIVGGLLLISAPVALVSAATFGGIYLAVSFFTRGRLRRNSQIIARANTARIRTVQEGLGGIRDILLDRSQPMFVRRFARIDTELRDAQAANALITASPRFVIEALGMILIVLLALVMSRQAGGLARALPVLGALALGGQRLLPLLQQVYNGWTATTGSKAALLDVLDFLDLPQPPSLPRGAVVHPVPFEQAITFADVSFRYAADGPAVARNLSFRIEKGMRVGIIGKTGSGKSTLMDLLMGLLAPTAGTILIDDRPLDTASLAGWRAQVAHVPQQIFLSDASIAENIAFGVPARAIDHALMREAARQAELEDFVLEQPDGFDSVVGERGVRLSGGQRQRIGIARALYKRSGLLVLDEATSALDDVTEAAVMQAIGRLGDDLTVVMIAHRYSTLRTCDVILRLARGAIVEVGSYAEVIGRAGGPIGPEERKNASRQVA